MQFSKTQAQENKGGPAPGATVVPTPITYHRNNLMVMIGFNDRPVCTKIDRSEDSGITVISKCDQKVGSDENYLFLLL